MNDIGVKMTYLIYDNGILTVKEEQSVFMVDAKIDKELARFQINKVKKGDNGLIGFLDKNGDVVAAVCLTDNNTTGYYLYRTADGKYQKSPDRKPDSDFIDNYYALLSVVPGGEAIASEHKENKEKEKIQKEIDEKLSGPNRLAVTHPMEITLNDLLTKGWGIAEVETSIWDLDRDFFFWEPRKAPEWEGLSNVPPFPVTYLGRKINSFGYEPFARHEPVYEVGAWFEFKDKKEFQDFVEDVKTDFKNYGHPLVKIKGKKIGQKDALGTIIGRTAVIFSWHNIGKYVYNCHLLLVDTYKPEFKKYYSEAFE